VVLGRSLTNLEEVTRAKMPIRLPVVLSKREVTAVLRRLSGVPRLTCSLMYGAGFRRLECLRLRVKDVDFENNRGVVVKTLPGCFVLEDEGEDVVVVPKRYLNSTELLLLQNRVSA
jgi:integrase